MSFDWKKTNQTKVKKPYCSKLPLVDESLWEDMKAYLWSRDLDFETARRNLWYPSSSAGDEEPRIVLPCSSVQGGNYYWQARAIRVENVQRRYQSPHNVSRGDAVLVVYPINPKDTRAAVVEGPMDALAAAGEGVIGVATMGINPPPESLVLTSKLLRGIMVLCVADSDQSEGIINVMKTLLDLGLDCRLRSTYPYKDLADVTREDRGTYLRP
jgi:hypothetical protein